MGETCRPGNPGTGGSMSNKKTKAADVEDIHELAEFFYIDEIEPEADYHIQKITTFERRIGEDGRSYNHPIVTYRRETSKEEA